MSPDSRKIQIRTNDRLSHYIGLRDFAWLPHRQIRRASTSPLFNASGTH